MDTLEGTHLIQILGRPQDCPHPATGTMRSVMMVQVRLLLQKRHTGHLFQVAETMNNRGERGLRRTEKRVVSVSMGTSADGRGGLMQTGFLTVDSPSA
jgi:hypothetical protein